MGILLPKGEEMNELIKVNDGSIAEKNQKTVDARELHGFLKVGRKFHGWITGRIDDYEFKEGIDYVKQRSQTGPALNRFEVEYVLSLDMAKELSMIERTENGRVARKYFIEVEKKFRSIVETSLENPKLKAIPFAEKVFRPLVSIAESFGLEKNQALLYANKATCRETGVDFQNILQIELKNEKQEIAFTPTELGKRVGLSAQQFNLRLVCFGLQEKHGDKWVVLEKGKSLSVVLDAGKKHSDGTPIQQIKWYESVLEFFKQDLTA